MLEVTPTKHYCRLLYQRVNELILVPTFLREIFVELECGRLPFFNQNQSTLHSTDYTRLFELLADASRAKNEIEKWKKNRKGEN